MKLTQLGKSGPTIGAIGLGCMGMSWLYAESRRDDNASVAVIHEALDLGMTLLDTADMYGDGHNESLLGRALSDRRDEATVATKGGLVVDDLEGRRLHRDGTPDHMCRAVEASLKRLGTDAIDLYYLHRVDPAVPLEETWGALAELVGQGKVRHLGLSEVTAAEATAAHRIHPVTAVQSELSLWTRDAMDETLSGDVLGWCAANGAAFVPFAPLGRGFLTGTISTTTAFEEADIRSASPRFSAAARQANERIIAEVRAVAARHDATPAQVALAWVLAQGDQVIPIPGTKQSRYLQQNAGALAVELGAQDLAALTALPVAVGTRY